MISDMEEYKLRLATLQSQHEGAVARHQKEMESLKQSQSPNEEANENFRKQIEDLTSKLAQQSKQLSQQQQNKPSTSSGPVTYVHLNFSSYLKLDHVAKFTSICIINSEPQKLALPTSNLWHLHHRRHLDTFHHNEMLGQAQLFSRQELTLQLQAFDQWQLVLLPPLLSVEQLQ